MIKLYLTLGLIAILSAGGWYILHLKGENSSQALQISVLQESVNQVADDANTQITGFKNALAATMKGYSDAYDQKEKFANMLARHDLATLAKAQPDMVATRINDATKRVFLAIEQASRGTQRKDSGTGTSTKTSPNSYVPSLFGSD